MKNDTRQGGSPNETFADRIINAAKLGGWEYWPRSGRLDLSQEARRIHGIEPGHDPTFEELMARYSPDAQPAIRAAVERALSTGESWDLELSLRRTDGRSAWVRSVGVCGFADGNAAYVTASLQEITQYVAERDALVAANERMLIATNTGGIGIFEWDLCNGNLIWDAGVFGFHGIDPSEGVPDYERWQRMVHPDDLDRLELAAKEAIDSGLPLDVEFRIIRPDGTVRHLRSSGFAVRDTSGNAVRFIGANWDVTGTRGLIAQLAEQHELLRVTLQSIGDAVITTDAHGNITWLNPVAEQMTDWPASAAAGRPAEAVFKIVDERTRLPVPSPLTRCVTENRAVGLADHTVLISRCGNELAIEDSAAPIRAADGQLLGSVLVFRDVTEQRRLAGEATYRASHDTLTGLPNRAAFHDMLPRMVYTAEHDGAMLAVLFVDLDRFKLFNDTFGHAIGDRILQETTARMRSCLRHDDFIARLGGDEFVIVSPNIAQVGDADLIARKLLAALSKTMVIPHLPDLEFSASIGLAVYPHDATDAETLLHHADLAMYGSKERTRNGYQRYGSMETKEADQSRILERRMFRGLDNAEFAPFYQPIVSLNTGRLCGMEALARWLHPQLGVILPAQFIELAEQSHIIVQLGEAILRAACTDVARWRKSTEYPDLYVSVNLSAIQLCDTGFLSTLHQIVADSGAAPDALVLEVTESILIGDESAALRSLRALSGAGIRIAIDDFGTGYSSLASLRRFPVDIIKIDKSFLRDHEPQADQAAIVRAIITMAHSLNREVVAEGVESSMQVARLRAERCDTIQGFFISEPLPLNDATAFIHGFDADRLNRSDRRRVADFGKRQRSGYEIA